MRKNIPHLVGLEESEVFSRATRRSQKYYSGCYLFYDYAWVYGERVAIRLETRLYDVKTKALIWAGESQTMDPKTTGQAIGQVVDAVMNELKKADCCPGS